MPANGQFPDSYLAPIPGGRLQKEAAAAWNAMLAEAKRRGLPEPRPDGVDSSYRPYARQVYWKNYWCGQGHCENAATPGTSRHGEGIAVDCSAANNNHTIALIGEKYGWSKKWSDAPWEPWHHTYKSGIWSPPKPAKYPQRGSRGVSVFVLTHRLAVCGYLPHSGIFFNQHVEGAVKAFQHRHNLAADGVVGPVTDRTLAQSAAWCKKHKRHEV